MVTELWAFINSRTRPRVNRAYGNTWRLFALQAILLPADRIRMSQRKLQRATIAVHNRAAACVAAGGDILENQLKHKSIEIKGNFTKLTLHLYSKCIMYYAGLLFSSVHCQ